MANIWSMKFAKLVVSSSACWQSCSRSLNLSRFVSECRAELQVGGNTQGNGEVDWDGRVLPDLEFWQMDVGMEGLDVDNPSLSGLLGETARLVLDDKGHAVMEGPGAFRGTVEDYRVSGPLGASFALLDQRRGGP